MDKKNSCFISRFFYRYKTINLTVADQMVVSGINFITTIVLARYLGLAEFGIFSAAWMVVQFFNVLQTGLIIQPMMSIAPKITDERTSAYFGAVFFQQLILSVLSMLVLAIFMRVGHNFFPQWKTTELLLPLTITTAAFQFQDFFRRYFFTIGQPENALINDIISYGGQVILILGMFYTLLPSSQVAFWAIGLTSLMACIWGFLKTTNLNFDKITFLMVIKQHWLSGSWLTITQIIQWLASLQGILIIVAFMLGTRDLGGIRAVINIITGPVNLLLQGLQNYLPIQASIALKNYGHQGLIRYLNRAGSILLGLFGIMIFLVIIFRFELMQLFYGIDYLHYANLIPWQGGYIIAVGLNLPFIIYFRTIEKTKILAFSSVLSASLAAISAILLINHINLPAIFISVITGQIIALACLLFYVFFKTPYTSVVNMENSHEIVH